VATIGLWRKSHDVGRSPDMWRISGGCSTKKTWLIYLEKYEISPKYLDD
jgi:hypothetical protein